MTARVGQRVEQYEETSATPTSPDGMGAYGRSRAWAGRAISARHVEQPLLAELQRSVDTIVALLVLVTVFLVANVDRMPHGLEEFLLLRLSLKNALLLAAFAFVWPRIFFLFGLYDARRLACPAQEARATVAACTVGSLLTLTFPVFSRSHSFGLTEVVYVWLLTIAATLAARRGLTFAAGSARAQDVLHVLIVGSGPRAARLYCEIAARPERYRLVGFVDSNNGVVAEEIRRRTLAPLDGLARVLMNTPVDEVLIALPIKSRYAEIQRVIECCERAGVQSKYLADVFDCSLARPRYEAAEAFPVVALPVVTDDYRLVIKRAIDVAGAALGLVLLSPALLAIAVAIRATSPGPVIFSQERYGFRKRRFRMLKFRTMVADAEGLQSSLESRNEASGPVFKIRDDPRLTAVGRFLRRWSLDELPQLVNVLRGEMSLVGPRPLPTRDVRHFSEDWLMRRFSVVPGLTCLWQISGRCNLGFDDWVALDLKYIDQWSLGLDFRILARTLPAVLRGVGAT